MCHNKHMRGFIFDKDGTLFDTEPIYHDVWYEMSCEMGFVVQPKWYDDLRGLNGQELIDLLKIIFPGFSPAFLIDELTRRARKRQLTEQKIRT